MSDGRSDGASLRMSFLWCSPANSETSFRTNSDRSFDLRVTNSQLPVDSPSLEVLSCRRGRAEPQRDSAARYGQGIHRSPIPCARHDVLQACRIVVFATLFLSAACPEAAEFLANTGRCRQPRVILHFDICILHFELRVLRALRPSAFICGYIGFGCGLWGRAMLLQGPL